MIVATFFHGNSGRIMPFEVRMQQNARRDDYFHIDESDRYHSITKM